MSVRSKFDAQLKLLATSKVSISTATTTSFDFGTPDDINLAGSGSTYRPGDRLLVVFHASSNNSTDTVSFVVQDANDSSGSIGTPATAVTDGTLTGGTGDQFAHTSVVVQPGRPWVRCRVTSTGTTTTFVATCSVYAVPQVGM